MAKSYIDAEKLIAETERYKQGAAIARFANAGENADYFQGKVDLCNDLMHIIESLQQEQPDVDLEGEVEFYCINKKVKMTIQELINYYIDTECAETAIECGF